MVAAQWESDGVREYTIRVDANVRYLNGCANADEVIEFAVEDLLKNLRRLGLDPSPLPEYRPKEFDGQPPIFSKIHFAVKVDDAEQRDDWTLINELKTKLTHLVLPICIGMRTVGGEITPPYHPDILKVMKEVPGFSDLPIPEKIRILRERKLIS